MKILIIGAITAGITAAARLKHLDESSEIILFERGELLSFAHGGLPYHLSDTILKREDLILQTPESFHRRSDVDVRACHKVISIDRQSKTVYVLNKEQNSHYTESYDKLILCMGASPIVPGIPGINHPHVYTIWTISDVENLKKCLDSGRKHIAVLGAGAISLEVVENLHQAGHTVSLIETVSQVLPQFLDYDMSAYIEENLSQHGINLCLNSSVKSVEKSGKKLQLTLNNDKQLEVDLVILSMGAKPNSQIAQEAGLQIGVQGCIVVNEYLQTSDPDIYAAGDVIEVRNIPAEDRTMHTSTALAIREAKLTAENILGIHKKYEGTTGSGICRIFHLSAGRTGICEYKAKRLNIPYEKLYAHISSHSGYYPGARSMHIKMLYNKEGYILGIQIVGSQAVEKYINLISIAIKQKISVFELERQDLAYSPPYSLPYDALHIIASMAIGQLEGRTHSVFPDDISPNDLILDVREKRELKAEPLPGAMHIPLGELRKNMDKLDPQKRIIVMCAVGQRGYLAERILKQNGFNACNLSGGYATLRIIRREQ